MNILFHHLRRIGICIILALALTPLCKPVMAESKPLRLLALGDSLTAGYGVPESSGFVPRLEAALREKGYDVEVINAGVSGAPTSGGLDRLGWLLDDEPDAVMVELGANDAIRALAPKLIRANLATIIMKLQERSIPALLMGMKAPPNLGREYIVAFDSIYPDLAEKTGVLFMPFFLEGVAGDPELNQDDGIHPNERGVGVVVENVLPYVEKLLDSVKK